MNYGTIIFSLCFIAICLTGNQAQSSNISTPANPIITLERFPDAFGVKPYYKVSIYSDGKVIYEGRENVKTKGKLRDKISQQQLQQLISEFEKINYFSLKDKYGAPTDDFRKSTETCPQLYTDQPSADTSITINGKTKKVEHYHGCRGTDIVEKLTVLENRIDEIVKTSRWIYE